MSQSRAHMGGPMHLLKPGTCSQLRILDLESGQDRLILEADDILEAPNWAPDGKALYVNGKGRIARLAIDALQLDALPRLTWIEIQELETVNNDHLISADGQTLFVSAAGGVFRVHANGGVPERLTPEGSMRYYLHGISPCGSSLACTTIDPDDENRWGIRLVPVAGGAGELLVGGKEPLDGPEWTPDGTWIWFNGEIGAEIPGHARLFRIRPDGSDLERMTDEMSVDWFPHASPDGTQIAFLSYPHGTQGHPADLPVSLRLMSAQGGPATTLARLQGGQGTINVNSWSPDSRQIAYMAYPPIT